MDGAIATDDAYQQRSLHRDIDGSDMLGKV